MRQIFIKLSKLILLMICAVTLIAQTAIFAPEVGAASETNKTETENTNLNNNIVDADEELTLTRAITIDEAKKEAQEAVEEQLYLNSLDDSASNKEQKSSASDETQTTTDSSNNENKEVSKASTSSTSTGNVSKASYVSGSSNSGFLMDIDNPDPGYTAHSVVLSDADRDLAERIVMGEAGSTGYTGMALVAQCLRDTFVMGNYNSISDVISKNGYYASTSIKPSSTCKEVISYIFDQGGAAVQHRIVVFYATNYCSSSWHESQNYVCSYGYEKFFDIW